MKKVITKKMVLRILALALSVMFVFSNNSNSFACELNKSAETNNVQLQAVYGSLSGYGYKYDDNDGSFSFAVNGSWSPYAGCTIKTEGFSNSTSVTVKVYDSNGSCKTTKTLGANDEKGNIAIFNVPIGTYTVRYSMSNPSGGSIQVWIY